MGIGALKRMCHGNMVGDFARVAIKRVDLLVEEEHFFVVLLGSECTSDESLILARKMVCSCRCEGLARARLLGLETGIPDDGALCKAWGFTGAP